mmetsp:Transcript_71847/g.221919  ORF Transcript_71847/g.221919 Transcript_71847/m.221919 type:complete len:296 (-) Transcript_71847:694-1581(-)
MAHTRERHDEVLRGDRPLPVPVEGHQGLPDGNHVEVDRCIHGLHDVLLQLWSQRVLPREGIEELEVVHSASPCDVAVDCDALEGIGIRRATAAFQCWAKALECSHHLVDLQEAVSRGVDILEPRGQQLRHGPLALLRVCWHQSPPGVVYHGRRHGPQLRHSPGLNLWVDRGDPCDGEFSAARGKVAGCGGVEKAANPTRGCGDESRAPRAGAASSGSPSHHVAPGASATAFAGEGCCERSPALRSTQSEAAPRRGAAGGLSTFAAGPRTATAFKRPLGTGGVAGTNARSLFGVCE